jgi:hypothetical protein
LCYLCLNHFVVSCVSCLVLVACGWPDACLFCVYLLTTCGCVWCEVAFVFVFVFVFVSCASRFFFHELIFLPILSLSLPPPCVCPFLFRVSFSLSVSFVWRVRQPPDRLPLPRRSRLPSHRRRRARPPRYIFSHLL